MPLTPPTSKPITAPEGNTLSGAVLLRAFEQAHDGILVTDGQNLIVAANDAFCRLSGYSADELIGQNPRLLASSRATPESYATLWQSLDSVGYWEGE